jgi:SAM-dependent methyltransferase
MVIPETNAGLDCAESPDTGLCRSCSSRNLKTFYEVKSVPVNSCILLNDAETARNYPTGRIALAFCQDCGFIGNSRFDPELVRYTDAYEEQQSFSPRFNAFAEELAAGLIDRHGLRNKTVLEIGCGKGDFLHLICRLGGNKGIGIDPTYLPRHGQDDDASRVEFIADFYDERYSHLKADMICCRHTLEHIPNTAEFMRTVRAAIGDQIETMVIFELPDVVRVLREAAFWDIYYEHCSYFSLGSLARLFRLTGFDVQRLATEYDGQYLILESKPSGLGGGAPLRDENDLDELKAAVDAFQETYRRHIDGWRERISQIRARKERAAIWGSGSKCVAFLNALDINDEIEVIVDVNPFRHNKYLPGSGKRITSPESLKEYRPDAVIVMNPIYLDEIRASLKSMGLQPELTAV